MEKHLPNVLTAVWIVLFCSLGLWISRMVRPGSRGNNEDQARTAFDGGDQPESRPWVKISAQYHLLLSAVVLLVVPLLLLFPSAVDFRSWIKEGLGLEVLLKVGVFLLAAATALAYSWKRGDLDWRKDSFQQVERDPESR